MEARDLRAFVAVVVPADLRQEIGAVQERLRRAAGGVKWVEPENLHFTLRFLGQTSPTLVPGLEGCLREALADQSAFSLRLAGVGAFPNVRRPRVVWVGVAAGAEPLESLAGAVEAAVVAEGFPPEERPFRAHLTVGRVKDAPGPPTLSEAIEAEANAAVGEMEVAEVALMRSELRRAGPVYTPLAVFPLRREVCT